MLGLCSKTEIGSKSGRAVLYMRLFENQIYLRCLHGISKSDKLIDLVENSAICKANIPV